MEISEQHYPPGILSRKLPRHIFAQLRHIKMLSGAFRLL